MTVRIYCYTTLHQARVVMWTWTGVIPVGPALTVWEENDR